MIPFVGLGVFVLMTICCFITSFLPFKNQTLSTGYQPKPPQQTNSPFSYLTCGEQFSNGFPEEQDYTEISQRKITGLVNEQKLAKKDDSVSPDLKQNSEQTIKTLSDSGKGTSDEDDRSSNSSKTGNPTLQPSSSSTSLDPNSSESCEDGKGKTDSVKSSTSSSATDLPMLLTGLSDADNASSDEQKKVVDNTWNEIHGSFMNHSNVFNNIDSEEVRLLPSVKPLPSVKQPSDEKIVLFPSVDLSNNFSQHSSKAGSHLNIPKSSEKHTKPSSTDGKSVLYSQKSIAKMDLKGFLNSRNFYRRCFSETDLAAMENFANHVVNSKDIGSLSTQFMPLPKSTERVPPQKQQQQSQKQQPQQQFSVQNTYYNVTHTTERTVHISNLQTKSEKVEINKAETKDKKKSLRSSLRRSLRKLSKKLSENSSDKSTGKSLKKSVRNALKYAGRKVGIINKSKTSGQLKGNAKKTIKGRNSH